jgi:hypothetical protein
MNWISRMVMHHAARAYARSLPQELHADWGASTYYTVGQVRTALSRRHLTNRFVAIAYAAFLTEADYLAVAPELPVVIPYDLARGVFEQAKPWPAWSTYQQSAGSSVSPVDVSAIDRF